MLSRTLAKASKTANPVQNIMMAQATAATETIAAPPILIGEDQFKHPNTDI